MDTQSQKNIRLIKPQDIDGAPLRVAAYCRVSTTSDEQEESYSTQLKHYTKYIGENPEWELADIYADEGIRGTSIKNRDDFMRLVADAQRGKIDRVLVKSVSRFARNTQECLQYVRLLRNHGASVFFENENIDTDKLNDEVLLTMLGMVSQHESQSLSGNMKWSYKKRMESGEFNTCRAPYGFDLVDGGLVINEDEATVVRRIFDLFLSGMGKQRIADLLNAEKIPTKHGEAKWWSHPVDYILKNERYMGDALLQKRFTTDTVPPKLMFNKGEMPMYYVENSNPSIIGRDTFLAAKTLIGNRSKANQQCERSPLRSKIICPDCGRTFRKQKQKEEDRWVCCRRAGSRFPCRKITVRDETLKNAFLVMVSKLATNREYILTPLISRFAQMQLRSSHARSKVFLVDKEIAELSSQNLVVTRLYSKELLDFTEYTSRSTHINEEISKLRRKRRLLLAEDEDEMMLSDLRELNDTLAEIEGIQTQFDEELFLAIVEKAVPASNEEILFHLIGGLELKESLIP